MSIDTFCAPNSCMPVENNAEDKTSGTSRNNLGFGPRDWCAEYRKFLRMREKLSRENTVSIKSELRHTIADAKTKKQKVGADLSKVPDDVVKNEQNRCLTGDDENCRHNVSNYMVTSDFVQGLPQSCKSDVHQEVSESFKESYEGSEDADLQCFNCTHLEDQRPKSSNGTTLKIEKTPENQVVNRSNCVEDKAPLRKILNASYKDTLHGSKKTGKRTSPYDLKHQILEKDSDCHFENRPDETHNWCTVAAVDKRQRKSSEIWNQKFRPDEDDANTATLPVRKVTRGSLTSERGGAKRNILSRRPEKRKCTSGPLSLVKRSKTCNLSSRFSSEESNPDKSFMLEKFLRDDQNEKCQNVPISSLYRKPILCKNATADPVGYRKSNAEVAVDNTLEGSKTLLAAGRTGCNIVRRDVKHDVTKSRSVNTSLMSQEGAQNEDCTSDNSDDSSNDIQFLTEVKTSATSRKPVRVASNLSNKKTNNQWSPSHCSETQLTAAIHRLETTGLIEKGLSTKRKDGGDEDCVVLFEQISPTPTSSQTSLNSKKYVKEASLSRSDSFVASINDMTINGHKDSILKELLTAINILSKVRIHEAKFLSPHKNTSDKSSQTSPLKSFLLKNEFCEQQRNETVLDDYTVLKGSKKEWTKVKRNSNNLMHKQEDENANISQQTASSSAFQQQKSNSLSKYLRLATFSEVSVQMPSSGKIHSIQQENELSSKYSHSSDELDGMLSSDESEDLLYANMSGECSNLPIKTEVSKEGLPQSDIGLLKTEDTQMDRVSENYRHPSQCGKTTSKNDHDASLDRSGILNSAVPFSKAEGFRAEVNEKLVDFPQQVRESLKVKSRLNSEEEYTGLPENVIGSLDANANQNADKDTNCNEFSQQSPEISRNEDNSNIVTICEKADLRSQPIPSLLSEDMGSREISEKLQACMRSASKIMNGVNARENTAILSALMTSLSKKMAR